MEAKLVVVGGDAKPSEITLKLPSTIGRGRDATLTLPHPLVSRQHCRIYEHDGQLMVRDLGSLNGTFIGRERITEAVLPPGELLTVGTVTFRAVYDAPEGVEFAEAEADELADQDDFFQPVDVPDEIPDFTTVTVDHSAANDVDATLETPEETDFEEVDDLDEIEDLPEMDLDEEAIVEFDEEEVDDFEEESLDVAAQPASAPASAGPDFSDLLEEDAVEEVVEEVEETDAEPEVEEVKVEEELEPEPVGAAADDDELIEELDLDEIEDIEELMELEEVDQLDDFADLDEGLDEELDVPPAPPAAAVEEEVEMLDEDEIVEESDFLEEVDPEPAEQPASPRQSIGPPPGADAADNDDDDLNSFFNSLK